MALQVFVLTYLQLAALLLALNHFPEALPKRWETISIYVGLCSHLLSEDATHQSNPDILVEVYEQVEGAEPAKQKKRRKFSGNSKECKEVAAIIRTTRYADMCRTTELLYQPLLSTPIISSPLKPMILTPHVMDCCESRIAIRSRPSFPLVYTKTGTYIAASYHGHCQKCGKTYHYSYYEDNEEQILYDFSEVKYLQISTQTAFEIDYLDSVTNHLSICSSTFESVAELYTIGNMKSDNARLSNLIEFSRVASSDIPWKLNHQRLEEAWFIHRIGMFYQQRGILNVNLHTEIRNCRKDIEKLCSNVYDVIVKEVPRWISHMCSVPGCAERFAMLDGNEKLTRSMCSAKSRSLKLEFL